MKTKLPIRMIIVLIVVTLCFGGLTAVAHADDKLIDQGTIDKLLETDPDEMISLVILRFGELGERIDKMPSWPDILAAKHEIADYVAEQNDKLIEEMSKVADFEVIDISEYVPAVAISIAAGEVEKLKDVELIQNILLYVKDNFDKLGWLEQWGLIDPAKDTVEGDADSDGEFTILDATHIQRFLAGLTDKSQIDLSAADYDTDGEVTILDATAIQRTLAGLPVNRGNR